MSKRTLPIKQAKQKEQLTEQLNKVPVVHLACERTGISRATFYRWKKADQEFADAVDEAIASGASLINDLAESKLIAAIKEGHMTGIIYWLRHHHPAYTTRVELSMQQNPRDELTPEQQELVTQSLALAGITETNSLSNNHEKDKGERS